ncbi:MAG: AAA family ATPase, partial [Sediminibacterium sp.]|nr:AAA family ATPase [Sediminibacterium sp.]
MQISVQNLGPIKEGTVDFSKKLTVFCGPNGTGKTYMAMLIRAYYLFFNGYSANNILKESVFNAFNEKINNSALKG